jgi:hypothetical protein
MIHGLQHASTINYRLDANYKCRAANNRLNQYWVVSQLPTSLDSIGCEPAAGSMMGVENMFPRQHI